MSISPKLMAEALYHLYPDLDFDSFRISKDVRTFTIRGCIWETVCKYIMPTCVHHKTIKQNVRKCYDVFRKHCNEVEKRYFTLRSECKDQKIVEKDTFLDIDSTEITVEPNNIDENDAAILEVHSPSDHSIAFLSSEISDVSHVVNDAAFTASNCLPSVTSSSSGSRTSRDKIRDSPRSSSRKKMQTDFLFEDEPILIPASFWEQYWTGKRGL